MATILVVDDLAVHRRLAGSLIMKQPGWDVMFASDGKEALEKLASQTVDVVVTDLMMPELDGLGLLRAMKRDSLPTPVILMTASGSEEVAVQALQEGAASYVPKRVLADRLVDTVNSVLAAANNERTHAELCRRMISLECSFAIENDIGVVMSTPAYVTAHLSAAGFGDRLAQLRTRMALEEALVNAMYHGNLELGSELKAMSADDLYQVAEARRRESPYAERRIHVRAAFSSERAEFTIGDDGKGFRSAALIGVKDTSCLDRPHGRGVMLMRTFMDEVRYNDVGNEVTMVKRWMPTPCSS